MASDCVSFVEWKGSCRSHSDNFINQMGDRIWDEFNCPADNKYLFKKIAISLFGQPQSQDDNLGLNEDQQKLVNDIQEKFANHSFSKSKIRIAVMFVFVYINDIQQTMVPLFRVMNKTSMTIADVTKSTFVDHVARVYESFQQYQDDNTWTQSWLCVPKEGYYSEKNGVIFLDQSFRGQVLETIDNVYSVANITTSAFMVAGTVLSFFPLTAPIGVPVVIASSIVGAPGALYGVGRSVGILVDRATHEQSINLSDSTARQCWLTTAASLLSVGTMASTKVLATTAKSGTLVSTTTKVMCNTLNITTISMSGLGVLNSFCSLRQKDDLTALDVFQLTTSIFFFTHRCLSFQTAGAIIRNAQREEISRMRSNLPNESRDAYDAYHQGQKDFIIDDRLKVREMQGNLQFIKEMKKINDVPEFFSHFKIATDGQFHINNELTIHPRAYLQISEADRATLLDLSGRLSRKEITLPDFERMARPIQREFQIRLDKHRVNAQDFLKKVYKVDDLGNIEVGNFKFDQKPRSVDRLESVVKNSFHNGEEVLLKVVEKISVEQGVTSVTEYCAAGEYAIRKIDAEVRSRQAIDPNPKRPPGIKAKDFYRSQVANEYLQNQDNKMTTLNDSFSQLRAECDRVNTGNPRFNNPMAAANHYDKHPNFPKVDARNNLTPQRYFEIATEMARGKANNIKWTQDGTSLKCTFNSNEYGAMAIRFDNVANGTQVIATLMSKESQATPIAEESRLYAANP